VNVSRNGQASGGPAYLVEKWKQPSVRWNEGRAKLTDAINRLQSKQQPVLAPFQPVAVTATLKGEKVPLLIYRSYWGIHATHMKTGKIVWESASSWGLDRMAHDAKGGRIEALNAWCNFYFNSVQKPALLLENSTVGTLTTDGSLVFAVEDFQVPP